MDAGERPVARVDDLIPAASSTSSQLQVPKGWISTAGEKAILILGQGLLAWVPYYFYLLRYRLW